MLAWLLPAVGTAAAIAFPLGWHIQTLRHESAAEELLRAVRRAQITFRSAASSGGYATNVASLLTTCPAPALPGPPLTALAAVSGYTVTLRPAFGSAIVGVDCHGRSTSSDYYVAVAPGPDPGYGRRAFAMTSDGRIFVFFDGVAPLEQDMEAGGLATPRDALDTFKIP